MASGGGLKDSRAQAKQKGDTSAPNLRACGAVTLGIACGVAGQGTLPTSAQMRRARLREVSNLSKAPQEVKGGGLRVGLAPKPSPGQAVRFLRLW